MIEKAVEPTLRFTGVGGSAVVTDQVIVEVEVPGGRQTVNFPLAQLEAVTALLVAVAADEDVIALVPEPEPDDEPEGEPEP